MIGCWDWLILLVNIPPYWVVSLSVASWFDTMWIGGTALVSYFVFTLNLWCVCQRHEGGAPLMCFYCLQITKNVADYVKHVQVSDTQHSVRQIQDSTVLWRFWRPCHIVDMWSTLFPSVSAVPTSCVVFGAHLTLLEHTLAVDICLSVRLSVKRVDCDKYFK